MALESRRIDLVEQIGFLPQIGVDRRCLVQSLDRHGSRQGIEHERTTQRFSIVGLLQHLGGVGVGCAELRHRRRTSVTFSVH